MGKTSERVLSLDVFRGLTVVLMIVVNTPGDWNATYAPLLHAQWHGFTPTDLVFPTFLFIVGAALSFSPSLRETGNDGAVLAKVARRIAIIFLLGVLLNWFPFMHMNEAGQWMLKPLSGLRLPGVLQRIALCFGAAALIVRYGKERGALAFCVAALLGYWAMLIAWGDYTLAGNAVRKLDLALLGASHLYRGEGMPFDPEGLLSTLPAIVNVIAGWFAGNVVRDKGAGREAVIHFLAAGAICAGVALNWNAVLPINKKLWTGSYALLAIGLDLILLAMLVWLIDMQRLQRWAGFFEIFGKNALFIYLLSEVMVLLMLEFRVGGRTLYASIYEAIRREFEYGHGASLLFAVGAMLVCWCVAYAMDKRRIYVRI